MAKQTKKTKREVARAKAKATVCSQNGVDVGSISDSSAMSPRVNMLQLALVWSIILLLISLATGNGYSTFATPATPVRDVLSGETVTWKGFRIPQDLTGPYTDYPNPLGITEEARQAFHPVVVFPKIRVLQAVSSDYDVLDFTSASGLAQLASEEQREAKRDELRRTKFWQRKQKKQGRFAVGRYDENRANLYVSDIFQDAINSTDGRKVGARTLHVGIDIDCPVGTKVHAFSGGTIHSAGYNNELGDYGNVIVVEHDLGGACSNETRIQQPKAESSPCKIWALYGHLDSKSIKRKRTGARIKKGQMLGRVGDIHENGGWLFPHVHFQLSINPPETHDMPGVVSMENRAEALVEYPDPRLVLGPIY